MADLTQAYAQAFRDDAPLGFATVSGYENSLADYSLPGTSSNFRCRLKLFSTTGYSGTIKIQFRLDGAGSYADVPTSGGNTVNITASNFFANNDPTTETMIPALFTGKTYVNGVAQDTSNSVAITLSAGQTTELEWSLRQSSGLTGGHFFDLRVSATGPVPTFSFTPRFRFGVAVSGAAFASFRFVNDDADQNNGAFMAQVNRSIVTYSGKQLRIRCKFFGTASPPTDAVKMRIRVNDGSVVDLPASGGTTINCADSSFYTNKASVTSERLPTTSGTFLNGYAMDTGNVSDPVNLNGKKTEMEWCFKFNNTAGAVVDFYPIYSGGTALAASAFPRITVYVNRGIKISGNGLKISGNTLKIKGS